ncbi:3-isopropylmalate dehydratase small subunit [Acetobacteraceae bacterium ESL0709]|nr:3-isopropylmalate dehydratase small subunit [Acetobacteraceae bacterium ESL0697]MDF7677989.1 3-isopropylmalate dehydratase small subunit [Acetobacteraceae bacterium ESL0709]
MNRKHVIGRGMPLRRSNLDTDQIIPARFCLSTERSGFGIGLFGDLREEKDFVLNDSRYAGATILVAGAAFATGSSREYAVWAIKDFGFKAVIAESFGDIFTRNAVINDLLPIKVSGEACLEMWKEIEENPGTRIDIDLETMTVSTGHKKFAATIEESLKQTYICNEDQIERNFRYIDTIDAIAEKRHGRLARDTSPFSAFPFAIAIIGSGPRGVSVLERLVARLIEDKDHLPTEIYLIDDGFVGTGRIWRTDQSDVYIMNTIASEISAFSGPWSKGEEIRPGRGPSFAQWLELTTGDFYAYGGYAPRAKYGEYLLFVLDTVENYLPKHVQLIKLDDRVIDLIEEDSGQTLTLQKHGTLRVSASVIATGYQQTLPTSFERPLIKASETFPEFTFIEGESAADMPLDTIAAGETVGMIGLGLSFLDIASELTIGRGGAFIESENGILSYQASGREPKIIAGSRSGMPILPRGRNQKPFDYEYHPVIFTQSRAAELRTKGLLHFDRDCLPLIEAELTLVHAETRLRAKAGDAAAFALRQEVAANLIRSASDVAAIAREHGLDDPVIIDLKALASPFAGCHFSSRREFTAELERRLEDEYKEAAIGNIDSPMKAALDVLRNTRSVIRTLVDFGGLDPHSHKTEFMGWFSPATNFLSAGPPLERIRQLLALMDAGIVEIAGPNVQFNVDYSTRTVTVSSPVVSGSAVAVSKVIDARIPVIDLGRDRSPFMRALQARGIFQSFIAGYGTDEAFDTGGVFVTQSPFHPIRSDGTIAERLFVLGMPTEHIRWFMQSGSSRPTKWIDFMIDADAIAAAAIGARC